MSKPTSAPSVAAFLSRAVVESGKLQREIAHEIGYDHPNVVTMIKQGKTKLPLCKVGPMAKALDVDPLHLLQITMMEYMPDTWDAIKGIIGTDALSADERLILEAYRHVRGTGCKATP